MKQVARRVEFQHRRRCLAAFAKAALQLAYGAVHGAGAMHHPDMVVGIDPDADRHAHDPVIGQRLGPVGIDFEFRRHVALGNGFVLKGQLPHAKRANRDGKSGTNHEISRTNNFLIIFLQRAEGRHEFLFPLRLDYTRIAGCKRLKRRYQLTARQPKTRTIRPSCGALQIVAYCPIRDEITMTRGPAQASKEESVCLRCRGRYGSILVSADPARCCGAAIPPNMASISLSRFRGCGALAAGDQRIDLAEPGSDFRFNPRRGRRRAARDRDVPERAGIAARAPRAPPAPPHGR